MALGEKEGKEKIPKKFLFIFGFFQKNKKKIPPTCFGPYVFFFFVCSFVLLPFLEGNTAIFG